MPLGVTPYIIAEAGTNHADLSEQDRYSRVFDLMWAAKSAGADAVKFQLFRPPEDLFCPMEGDDKRFHRWWQTTISDSRWKTIHTVCQSAGIDLILSAFQPSGVELINELGITHKVASRAAGNYPYDMMRGQSIGSNGFVRPRTDYVLQCAPEYPVPLSRAAWEAPHLESVSGEEYLETTTDGLSDHSGAVWPAIDALARGAGIIEVHFRPEGFEPGPDAPVELTTSQLKLICEARDAFTEMRQG